MLYNNGGIYLKMIFMKIKRKGLETGTLNVIGAFVIVGLTVWIIMKLLTGTAAGAATQLGSLDLNNRHQLCELTGKKIIERGLEPKETIEGEKKDGFPDDCDLCLGGDDRIVTNSYGIPDACYYDPTKEYRGKKIDSYKDMCKVRGGCYISDTVQCCLMGKSKCGEKCK